MTNTKDLFDIAGYVVEAAGVLTIVVGSSLATIWFLTRLTSVPRLDAYRAFRFDVGHAIILGLEFLIEGDIIRTLTVAQTLELAIEGRWPWQQNKLKNYGEKPMTNNMIGRFGMWRVTRWADLSCRASIIASR